MRASDRKRFDYAEMHCGNDKIALLTNNKCNLIKKKSIDQSKNAEIRVGWAFNSMPRWQADEKVCEFEIRGRRRKRKGRQLQGDSWSQLLPAGETKKLSNLPWACYLLLPKEMLMLFALAKKKIVVNIRNPAKEEKFSSSCLFDRSSRTITDDTWPEEQFN